MSDSLEEPRLPVAGNEISIPPPFLASVVAANTDYLLESPAATEQPPPLTSIESPMRRALETVEMIESDVRERAVAMLPQGPFATDELTLSRLQRRIYLAAAGSESGVAALLAERLADRQQQSRELEAAIEVERQRTEELNTTFGALKGQLAALRERYMEVLSKIDALTHPPEPPTPSTQEFAVAPPDLQESAPPSEPATEGEPQVVIGKSGRRRHVHHRRHSMPSPMDDTGTQSEEKQAEQKLEPRSSRTQGSSQDESSRLPERPINPVSARSIRPAMRRALSASRGQTMTEPANRMSRAMPTQARLPPKPRLSSQRR